MELITDVERFNEALAIVPRPARMPAGVSSLTIRFVMTSEKISGFSPISSISCKNRVLSISDKARNLDIPMSWVAFNLFIRSSDGIVCPASILITVLRATPSVLASSATDMLPNLWRSSLRTLPQFSRVTDPGIFFMALSPRDDFVDHGVAY